MIPFQKALRLNLYLWGSWLVIAVFAFAMQSPGDVPLHVALAAALWLTIPAFLLGMAWWPICQQLRWKRLPASVFWISHVFQAVLFSALWLTIALGSAWWLIPDISNLPLDWVGIAAWLFPMGIMLYTILTGGYYFMLSGQLPPQRHMSREHRQIDVPAPKFYFSEPIDSRFIFETLEFAHDSITESPGTARQVLKGVNQLLALVLDRTPNETVSLARELELIHHYVALVKIQMKEQLQYEEIIDPALYQSEIPVMTLQPLLENAIAHGIDQEGKGGWIRLNINQQDNNMVAIVENSLGKATISRTDRNVNHRENTSLRKLQQRLALVYGESVQFSAQPVPEKNLFRVQFQLPSHRTRPLSRNT